MAPNIQSLTPYKKKSRSGLQISSPYKTSFDWLWIHFFSPLICSRCSVDRAALFQSKRYSIRHARFARQIDKFSGEAFPGPALTTTIPNISPISPTEARSSTFFSVPSKVAAVCRRYGCRLAPRPETQNLAPPNLHRHVRYRP